MNFCCKYLNTHKFGIAILLLILVAFFLRVYRLSEIPASLSPDEAALGYTAFSLLKTGADTNGNFLPITYSVFGGAWTLLGYPLITAFFVATFGLTEFSTRLPSAIAGVMGTFLIYQIAKIFFNRGVGLISAVFFAFSPWNIYFSRMAYEANLALAFFLGGIFFLSKYLFQKENSRYILFSALCFSATLFTYYSYFIFLPIFVLALFIIYFKKLPKNTIGIVSLVLLLASSILVLNATHKNSLGEASTLGIFNDENIIYNRADKFRTDGAEESILFKRLLFNKFSAVAYQFLQNYINTYSPAFLFDKGGDKLVNDMGYFGKLYLIDVLFIFVGVIALSSKRIKASPILLAWLILGPIPSAITRDAPSSTRLYLMMPLFTLVSAFGAYQLLSYFFKTKFKVILTIVLSLSFLLNVIYFLDLYYPHFNFQRVRFLNYGYREAVLLTNQYPASRVYMRGPENFPFIYFLFYNAYDPGRFVGEAKLYAPTFEGFHFVKSFGRYQFVERIDYSKTEENTIYIDDTRLDDKSNSIFLPSGEPILGYHIVGNKK